MRSAIVALALCAAAPACALDCSWAAPDNTGRVYARDDRCLVTVRSYSLSEAAATEIIVGARDAFWSISGSVGRHIIPGYTWTKGGGWSRDASLDQVIWSGSVKQTSAPCHADGKGVVGGWDFSNGMRICTGGR
jgi:hypothetical protein